MIQISKFVYKKVFWWISKWINRRWWIYVVKTENCFGQKIIGNWHNFFHLFVHKISMRNFKINLIQLYSNVILLNANCVLMLICIIQPTAADFLFSSSKIFYSRYLVATFFKNLTWRILGLIFDLSISVGLNPNIIKFELLWTWKDKNTRTQVHPPKQNFESTRTPPKSSHFKPVWPETVRTQAQIWKNQTLNPSLPRFVY